MDDSGVCSTSHLKTPVVSKKRSLAVSSGKTSSVKKRKLSIGQDRSQWHSLELPVSGDEFLSKQRIVSGVLNIEDSEWSIAVHRRMAENECLDEEHTNKNLMVEVCLQCAVPSAAWCAKCKIELEVVTDTHTFRKEFDCMITSSSNSRGIILDWRRDFLRGGRVSAYLLISRVCNKFLNFPDFTVPGETGNDKLTVGGQILYVDKNLLSLHSGFFSRIFSSKGPYKLEGKVEDIVATLQTVYPQKGVIDDSNACTIAVIAKVFEFWDTLERCEQYLLSSDQFTNLEKMEISLRCQMHSLLNQCSEGINSMEDVIHLMETQPEGFEASEKTKSHLFDKVLLLGKKKKDEQVNE